MNSGILVVALLLLLTIPAIAQRSFRKHGKKFSHEFSVGLCAVHFPAESWRNDVHLNVMPEYSISYPDRYQLKVRMFGGWGPFSWGLRNSKSDYHKGHITSRKTVYWDFLPFYNLKIGKRHSIHIGAGYTMRKGQDGIIVGIWDNGVYTEPFLGIKYVNDKGIITELGYSYHFGKRFVAGADIAYRVYGRGDPVITAGVQFGIVLRH